MQNIAIVLPTLVSILFYWFPMISEENNRNNKWYWVVGISGTAILILATILELLAV